jgi:UTP--glucose-1-phosphate uridylyltransferase
MAVVGRYIIEPAIFEILEQQNRGASNEIQLTDAIASRIGSSSCGGYKFSGERFDCGSKLGFIQANIKLSVQRSEMKEKLKSWLQDEILDGKI